MDSGPIVGAALLVGLSEGLCMAKEMAPLFFGGILILVIFWLPGGLLTLPEEARKQVRRIRAIFARAPA